MIVNLNRLNINIRGARSTGLEGGEEQFKEVEELIDRELPEEYKVLIRHADGGHPEVGSFLPVGDDPSSKNYFDIDWFYSFNNQNCPSIKDAVESWGPLLGIGSLPLARDGGGNQIYMDLDSGTNSIWLYLHDQDGLRLKLANNLRAFLDGLVSNPDFI